MAEAVDQTVATVIDFAEIEGVDCPSGISRRAFEEASDGAFTLHTTTITAEARTHYHRKLTEGYYILLGTGDIELDGACQPVHPGMAVHIPPGVRHCAVVAEGTEMTVAIFVTPAFDPSDEWFD